MLHRDVKPANLGHTPLVGGRNRLTLFDFSLARRGVSDLVAGTPPYLDPFLGGRDRPVYDSAAEWYASAVVLYEMATSSAHELRRRGQRPGPDLRRRHRRVRVLHQRPGPARGRRSTRRVLPPSTVPIDGQPFRHDHRDARRLDRGLRVGATPRARPEGTATRPAADDPGRFRVLAPGPAVRRPDPRVGPHCRIIRNRRPTTGLPAGADRPHR